MGFFLLLTQINVSVLLRNGGEDGDEEKMRNKWIVLLNFCFRDRGEVGSVKLIVSSLNYIGGELFLKKSNNF